MSSGAPSQSLGQRLGLSEGWVVLEIGYDEDCDEQIRQDLEEAVGSPLEDEDYQDVVDAVLLWWRDGDGDLTDAVMDALTMLEEGGPVVVLTPRVGLDGAVDPAELAEAATTAGLHTSGSFKCGSDWTGTKLVPGKARR